MTRHTPRDPLQPSVPDVCLLVALAVLWLYASVLERRIAALEARKPVQVVLCDTDHARVAKEARTVALTATRAFTRSEEALRTARLARFEGQEKKAPLKAVAARFDVEVGR